MPWFRLDDAAMYHPKVSALSDGAFRLWIEGGVYCTRHLTDGHITDLALRSFRYATKPRIQELATVHLWDVGEAAGGYVMHDYLDWQEPKAAIVERKDAARARMRKARSSRGVRANAPRTSTNGSRELRAKFAGSYANPIQSDPIRSDPDLDQQQRTEDPSRGREAAPLPPNGDRRTHPDRRQAAPIFLHPWQEHELVDRLGAHAETFNLDLFLADLAERAYAQALTFPTREARWAWVQAQFAAEIATRGLPVAGAASGKVAGLAAAAEAILRKQGSFT